MKPPANHPAIVWARRDGRRTKYGSITPARAPTSHATTIAASSSARPSVRRSRSAARRARVTRLDFIAQVLPDLFVEPRELLAKPDLDHVTRPRQRDRIARLHAAGAGRQDDHLVGERDRLLEIVRDEQHRVARVRPQLEQLVFHEIARLHV